MIFFLNRFSRKYYDLTHLKLKLLCGPIFFLFFFFAKEKPIALWK